MENDIDNFIQHDEVKKKKKHLDRDYYPVNIPQ